MARSRYQIHADARRVLVRHWIDTERITLGVHRGSVRIAGELHFTRPDRDDGTGHIIEVLRSELMRVRDVTRVYFDFTNWSKDSKGLWSQANRKGRTHGSQQSSGTGNTYELRRRSPSREATS